MWGKNIKKFFFLRLRCFFAPFPISSPFLIPPIVFAVQHASQLLPLLFSLFFSAYSICQNKKPISIEYVHMGAVKTSPIFLITQSNNGIPFFFFPHPYLRRPRGFVTVVCFAADTVGLTGAGTGRWVFVGTTTFFPGFLPAGPGKSDPNSFSPFSISRSFCRRSSFSCSLRASKTCPSASSFRLSARSSGMAAGLSFNAVNRAKSLSILVNTRLSCPSSWIVLLHRRLAGGVEELPGNG